MKENGFAAISVPDKENGANFVPESTVHNNDPTVGLPDFSSKRSFKRSTIPMSNLEKNHQTRKIDKEVI